MDKISVLAAMGVMYRFKSMDCPLIMIELVGPHSSMPKSISNTQIWDPDVVQCPEMTDNPRGGKLISLENWKGN